MAASAARRGVFIVSAKRTPFGRFGGKLKGLTATELGRVAASAALEAANVPPEAVDSVIVGNVAQVRSGRSSHLQLRVEAYALFIYFFSGSIYRYTDTSESKMRYFFARKPTFMVAY